METNIKKQSIKQIANNKKAFHDYFVLEKFECGIELFGTEVKSIRAGSCSVKESFCKIDKNEVFVENMHINPYERGNIFNKDPYRTRKLLLHKKEISKLKDELKNQGITLIPLSVYFKGSKVKVEIGLCKGKKLYDKRETSKKKEMEKKADYAAKKSIRNKK